MNNSPRLFLLFNHTLTEIQIADARESLGISEIIEIPEDMKILWREFPPEAAALFEKLQPVLQYLRTNARPGDYVLVQGDFGAVFLVVQFALDNGLVAVYSTTERDVVETHTDPNVVNVQRTFRHRRYRCYEKLSSEFSICEK